MSRGPAVRRAWQAGRWLRRAGARPGYFKIDSTLRGHPVAEAEALRRATGSRLTWLVPANPSMGRQTIGGRHFVNGRPLEATQYARDPIHPVATGNLLELAAGDLGAGACVHLPLSDLARGPAHVRKLRRAWLGAGIRLVVADARREADLARIAACIPADDLPMGSAALARHLLRRRMRGVSADAETPGPRGLAVIGSLNPLTAEQVRRASRLAGVLVHRLGPSDLERGRVGLPGPGVRWFILVLDPARFRRVLSSRSGQGERVARGLARVAARAVRGWRPARLLMSGGLTAAAVCEAAGIPALRLIREVAPGLVASKANGPAGAFLVLTKPGGFGSKDALSRIMREATA